SQMSPNYAARQGYNFAPFRQSGVFNEATTQRHVDDNFYLQGEDGSSSGGKRKKKGFGWFKQSSLETKEKRKGQTAFKVRSSSLGKGDNVSYTRTRHHRRIIAQPQPMYYPPYYSPQPYGYSP
ncbi:hypothetical protein, partial [Salmonella sp. s51228]|uniref:hypothetical protein n=1 Tax=Salmonella sp. s51228 TaxID=3159652 RepID=UPI003980BDA7